MIADEPQYRADYDGFFWQVCYWPLHDAPGFREKIASGSANTMAAAAEDINAAIREDVKKRSRSFSKVYNAAGEEVTQ